MLRAIVSAFMLVSDPNTPDRSQVEPSDPSRAAPGVMASELRLPRAASADVRYVVFALGSRKPIAEANGNTEQTTMVTIPNGGRYIVHRRSKQDNAAAHVVVGDRTIKSVTDAQFMQIDADKLEREGGEVHLWHHELGVGYAASTTTLVPFGEEINVHYAYEFDHGYALSLTGRIGYGDGRQPSAQMELDTRWLGLDGLFELRTPHIGSWITLRAGAGPTIEGMFHETRSDSRGVLFGAMARIGARLYFQDRAFLELTGFGRVFGGKLATDVDLYLAGGGNAVIGIRF